MRIKFCQWPDLDDPLSILRTLSSHLVKFALVILILSSFVKNLLFSLKNNRFVGISTFKFVIGSQQGIFLFKLQKGFFWNLMALEICYIWD